MKTMKAIIGLHIMLCPQYGDIHYSIMMMIYDHFQFNQISATMHKNIRYEVSLKM